MMKMFTSQSTPSAERFSPTSELAERLRLATTPAGIAAAYEVYGSELLVLGQVLRGTYPPSKCEDLARTLLHFWASARATASKYSTPKSVDTLAERRQADRDFAAVRQEGLERLGGGPLTRKLHC